MHVLKAKQSQLDKDYDYNYMYYDKSMKTLLDNKIPST